MPAQKAKPLTLTQAAFVMRKFIAGAGITLAILMVGRFALTAFADYWKATHPAPPPPPTVGFGPLPKLDFPTNVGTPGSIRSEIPPARLKVSSDRAKVFFIPAKKPSLLALEKARAQATVLGFLLEPESINSEVYRWRRTLPLTSVLDYNIVTGTFTMKLDWQSDPAFLQNKKVPNEETAIAQTRSLLSTAGLLNRDIATGSAKINYLKASGTEYATTVSLSESDFLQVDIYRTDVDSAYPVVTSVPNRGTIRAVITGSSDPNLQLASLDYDYIPVSYDAFHTYPIISPQAAVKMLQEGKAYTAAMPTAGSDVILRQIKLAYFDSGKEQQYLQPIYVLEGDGGYVGYVSAINANCQLDNQAKFKDGCTTLH